MRWFLFLALAAWPVVAEEATDAEAANPGPPVPVAEAPVEPPAPSVPVVPPVPFTPPHHRAVPMRPGPQVTQPVKVTPAVPVAGQAAHAGTVGVIDFQGTPLQAVLEYYSQNLAHRSIIQAPNLPATPIYFRSQSDLTVDEAKAALESVLAINQIALIPMGEKFLKVVQIQTAKQEGLPFIGEGKMQTAGDVLMTQVIQLKYAEVADVQAALQPYLHAYGQLLPLPKSNCILLTETAANVNQMLEIVKYIDLPSALKMETRIFVLAHAKAGDVVQRLQSIVQETQQLGARGAAPTTPTPTPGFRPGMIFNRPGTTPTTAEPAADDSVIEGKVVITSDERTNKIFILSRPSNFEFFEKIIAELDAKVDPDVIMKVVELHYATAEDAASAINSLITGGSPTYSSHRSSNSSSGGSRTTTAPPPPPIVSSGGSSGNATDTGFLQFAQGVRILPDPRTNALLVMATKEDMARIEDLIKSIDTPVSQVQIEVVIAEINLNNALDVGVNVFKQLFNQGQATMVGQSDTGAGPTSALQLPQVGNLVSSLVSNIPAATAMGSGLTYFTTFQNLGLDVVINALASTSRAKILSTPVIQTMDNQEGSITVANSVPVPVSQVSTVVGNVGTLATGALNSNIEYKDAGIELTVTPRINPDGYVRMDISQKVNDFGTPVQINGGNVPTIEKREAKSSVAVQDGSTVMLGGLITENKGVTETKVPFFGDIPWLGTLFKNKATTKVRTELIIFIRPVVLRNDAEAVAQAKRRARMLKGFDELGLDQQFKRDAFPDATSTNPPPNHAASTPSDPSADRYTAKMQALQEQTVKPEGN